MTGRHPGPAQKVAKNHLDYRPRPTTFRLRNRPQLWARRTECPEQSSERQAARETNTESPDHR